MARVKSFFCLICILCVLPAYLSYRFASLWIAPERAFSSWSQFYSLIPGICGDYLRGAFYSLTLQKWGKLCQIRFGTLLSRPQIVINDGVFIGAHCSLGMTEIGPNTLVGSGVHILSGRHQHSFERLDVPISKQQGSLESISIGTDCWIGNGSIIMADVGNCCVIGAGSVVTNPIPDYALAVGNPARVIRFRHESDNRGET